ncbi:MAG TPA: hypothetical protein PLB18_01110, partial [Acidobacteriota bacterium]|nr:hypothetical protein [Acidobacteriota bacterium]
PQALNHPKNPASIKILHLTPFQRHDVAGVVSSIHTTVGILISEEIRNLIKINIQNIQNKFKIIKELFNQILLLF